MALVLAFFLKSNGVPPQNPPVRQATPAPAAEPRPDPHEAQMLQMALQKNPGHVPVLLRLAKLAGEKHRNDEAIRYLRDAVRLEPRNVDARLELGKMLFESGDVAGAVEQNTEILKIRPASPDALYNLGAIYGNLGNNRLALDNWNRAVTADPNSESGKRAKEMLALLSKGTR